MDIMEIAEHRDPVIEKTIKHNDYAMSYINIKGGRNIIYRPKKIKELVWQVTSLKN
jgi:hypothetical protein